MNAKQANEIANSTIFYDNETKNQYVKIKKRILESAKQGKFSVVWLGSLYVNVIEKLKLENYEIKTKPNELMGIEFEIEY